MSPTHCYEKWQQRWDETEPCLMRVVALTGSIASGKTFALTLLSRFRVRTCNTDALVREMFVSDAKTKFAVLKRFPDAKDAKGEISRSKLAKQVYQNRKDLQTLEKIVHPRVAFYRQGVLKKFRRQRDSIVFCEIPLLFESVTRSKFFAVVMIFAPFFLRKKRAFRRDTMNEKHWRSITQRQIPDSKKRRFADAVVFSGLGRAVGGRSLVKALYRCRNKAKRKKEKEKGGQFFSKTQREISSPLFSLRMQPCYATDKFDVMGGDRKKEHSIGLSSASFFF